LRPAIHELVEADFAPRDVPDFGLPLDDYGRALDHLVQANVDVIVHTRAGDVLLGYRKDVPLRGRFWVFGRRMKPGEQVADTAARVLTQEVALQVDRGRLSLDNVYNVMWGSRTAPPENYGFQTIITLMRYECTADDMEAVAAADRTHEWIRWYSPAELRELEAAKSELLHPFLLVILRNAGLY
jgi:ADP-ribose pyrophosphatase YjhB (NUDIX family)